MTAGQAIEGQLDIRLSPGGDTRDRVRIHSSRPLEATRLLDGKRPEEARELIRLLFTLCGEAQSRAAEAALAQAEGRPERNPRHGALLVLMENAREHLLRLFIDGPRLLDGNDQTRQLQPIMPLLDSLRQAENDDERSDCIDQLDRQLAERVFAMPTGQWLDITGIDELERWIERCETPAATNLHQLCRQGWAAQGHQSLAALPPLDPRPLLQRMQEPGFTARPDWLGRQYETSSLTRQRYHPLIVELLREFGTGLLTRQAARLIELARLPGLMRQRLRQPLATSSGSDLPTGCGLAQVEAARGRLIHAVELRQGRIASYRILAPTEWNFHPRGPVASSLARIRAQDPLDRRRLAELIVQAIDPCVGYRLEVA